MAELSHDKESPTAPLSQEDRARVSTLSPGKASPTAPLSQETALVSALSPRKESPVAPLSQWLHLMLAEIARKREDLASARAEAARRELEAAPQDAGEPHGRDYVSAPSEVHGPSGR
jgi:hypothetical protein